MGQPVWISVRRFASASALARSTDQGHANVRAAPTNADVRCRHVGGGIIGAAIAAGICQLSRAATHDMLASICQLGIPCDLVERDSVYYALTNESASRLGIEHRVADPNSADERDRAVGAGVVRTSARTVGTRDTCSRSDYGGNGMTFGFLASKLRLDWYRGNRSADHDLFAFSR
jgi:hypothetical protein